MINRVTLLGNLTRDLKVGTSKRGTTYVSTSIVVNQKRNKKELPPMFINIIIYGNLAKNAANRLKKGSQVYLEGRLKFITWLDKEENKKRSKHIIEVSYFRHLNK